MTIGQPNSDAAEQIPRLPGSVDLPAKRRLLHFGRDPIKDPNTGTDFPLGEVRPVAEFTIVQVGDDCMVCEDDAEGGSLVLVAKPWQFRKTAYENDGEAIDGVTYVADADVKNKRTATPADGVAVTEYVKPAYAAGEKIVAFRMVDTVECVVAKDELDDAPEGTHFVDWLDANSAGRQWPDPLIAARYEVANAGTDVTASGATTVIPFTDSEKIFDTNTGITVAAGVFTVGAELDGRVLAIAGQVVLQEGVPAGFEATNGFKEVRIQSTAPGGSVRQTNPGLDETALTTDSTDPGGGHAHTHTIPAHRHAIYPAGADNSESTASFYLVSEGNTFQLSVRQVSGFNAVIEEADIFFAVVG